MAEGLGTKPMNFKAWKNPQTEFGEWGIPQASMTDRTDNYRSIEVGRVGNGSYWIEWARKQNVWRVFRRDLPLDLLEDNLGLASSESKARDLVEVAMNQRKQELGSSKGWGE